MPKIRYKQTKEHVTKCLLARSNSITEAKRILKIKAYWKNPLLRKNKSESVKALWKNPKYRMNQETVRKSSKFLTKLKTSIKNSWKDPIKRENRLRPMRSKLRSPEIRAKIKKSHNTPKMKCFHHRTMKRIWSDPKHRAKRLASFTSSEVRAKHSVATKRLWKDIEFVTRIMFSRQIKLSKPEEELNEILQKLFPKEYASNVKADILLVGGKVPDFVNVNRKKKLIELYGNYWHRGQDPNKRINYLKKFGWDTLVIWESELKDKKKLKEKLLRFQTKETKNF